MFESIRRRWSMGMLVSIIAVVQAIVAVVLIYTLADARGYQNCMAQWQQQWSTAQTARSGDAAKVGEAMDQMVLAIAAQDNSGFEVGLQQYITERGLQDDERLDNPLPALPETVCGAQ